MSLLYYILLHIILMVFIVILNIQTTSSGFNSNTRAQGMFYFHCNVYFFYTNVCLIVEYSYKWQHSPQKGLNYFNERGAQDVICLEPGYVFFLHYYIHLGQIMPTTRDGRSGIQPKQVGTQDAAHLESLVCYLFFELFFNTN